MSEYGVMARKQRSERPPLGQPGTVALATGSAAGAALSFVLGLGLSDISSIQSALLALLGAATAAMVRILFGLDYNAAAGREREMTPWLVEIASALIGSGILFFVALFAFRLNSDDGYDPAGSVLFGAVAGWLSAMAISGRLVGNGGRAPFSDVVNLVHGLVDERTPELLPQVEASLKESLIGVEMPAYEGWLFRQWSLPHATTGPEVAYNQPDEQGRGRALVVWFDSRRDSELGLDPDLDSRGGHPVVLIGQRGATSAYKTFSVELVLHVPRDPRSPMRQQLDVPFYGVSARVEFEGVRSTASPQSITLEVRVSDRIVTVAGIPD